MKRMKVFMVLALFFAVVIVAGDISAQEETVIEQFTSMNHYGEWLGFHKGGEGQQYDNDPVWEKYDNHNQGIVRREGGGTTYFVVTRSVEPPGSSTVMVVKMGSRDTDGERLRSNRMEERRHSSYVVPPAEDRVIFHTPVPLPQEPGDFSSVYKHPGSMQIVDDIVAIPLEKPRNPEDPKAKIIFMDLKPLDNSPPNDPEFLDYSLNLDGYEDPDDPLNDRPEHDAGILGMYKLPGDDGKILMAFTWGHNEELEFWLSNVSNLRDLGKELPDGDTGKFQLYYTLHYSEIIGYWPVKTGSSIGHIPTEGNGCYQGLSFVRSKGPLYLLGFRHTSSITPAPTSDGHNEVRAYEVGLEYDTETGGLKKGEKVTLTHKEEKDFSCKSLGKDKAFIAANFAAGTSAYVSPRGELIFYATEHWTDGPGDTYKMAEFRHKDVFRKNSPAYGPTVDVGGVNGVYMVNEGDSIMLDARGTKVPLAKAWLELYSYKNFEGHTVMFDVVDRPLRAWYNFSKIEDTDSTKGIDDWASSVRWFSPPGGTFTIWSDHSSTGGEKLVLNGTGKPESVPILKDMNMDDIFSSLDFVGTAEGSVEDIEWSIVTNSPLGDIDDANSFTPRYNAVEGKTRYFLGIIPVPSVERVEFTACSNLMYCDPSPCCNAATAMITVNNVAPEVVLPDSMVAECGIPYEIPISFSDPGVLDTHIAYVQYGDGFQENLDPVLQPGFELSYIYDSTGNYVLEVDVIDDDGGIGSESETISVRDTIAPEISCNTRDITPPDLPISFTATASDDCDNASVSISGVECYKFTKKGKRIDKKNGRSISVDGDTLTIHNSVGVGTNINWTVLATDPSGNRTPKMCEIVIQNPGNKNGKK